MTTFLLENAWLIPVLPLLSAAAIAAFGRYLPWRGAEIGIGVLAFITLHASVIAVVTFLGDPPVAMPLERSFDWVPLGEGYTIELGMLLDGLTAMMFLLVTLVSFLVHLYSKEYMAEEPRFTYFFAMLSLFTASMLILVIANTTILALIGWELVGVCSYLLIGFYWEEKSNQDAANKAFLVTKFADIGLVVGVIALFAGAGTFNILEITEAAVAGEMNQGLLVFGAFMIFLAAIGKSGQFPLHVWLPDAMAGPTPVSALIHAATMVTAGIFFIARLYPVFAQSLVVMTALAVIGTITLLVAGLIALVQDDIKRVLAYSTVSQLGYMMAALGIGGYTAGIFHLFTHGFFKALLFLGAGALGHAVHSYSMSKMGGMRRSMPVTFWTFIIGSLALAGFPLTAGFWSKDEILASGLFWGGEGFAIGTVVFALGLLAAFVTAFYMARACFLIFWGDLRTADAHPHDPGRFITVPLVVLAFGSLFIGWIGSPLLGERGFEAWTSTERLEEMYYPFIGDGQVAHILHGPPEVTTKLILLTLAALVIVVVAAFLAFRIYGDGKPERDPMLHMGAFSTALENKLWLDDVGYRGIVTPVRDRLAPGTYNFDQAVIEGIVRGTGGVVYRSATFTYDILDQKVIDGAVHGSAFSAGWWSEKLKWTQSGNVQRYAGAMFAGLIVLILIVSAT
jgi:NADH-quinone oxidoreductase subunit L